MIKLPIVLSLAALVLTGCASKNSTVEMDVTTEPQLIRTPLITVIGEGGPCTVTSRDYSVRQEGSWVGHEEHDFVDGRASFYFEDGQWIDLSVDCPEIDGHKYISFIEPYTSYIFEFPDREK